MFSSLILSIVSTTVIGGIVYIIFNLVFHSDDEEEQKQVSNKSVDNQFVDNRPQEDDKCLADTYNECLSEENVSNDMIKSDNPLNEEKTCELSSDMSHEIKDFTDQTSDQISEQSVDNKSEDLLDFEEVLKEADQLTDERPVEYEVPIDVNKDVEQSLENESKPESETLSDKELNEKQIAVEVIEDSIERQTVEDLKNEFWDLEESPNLKHLNKSRPKKHKSRPSIKVVFTEDLNDDNSDQKVTEDPITKNARELVDTLFESLDSDVGEYKKRIESEKNASKEVSDDENGFESRFCETTETTVSKNDDSFEEISSGEYKKFDEFSDYFRTESRKHEISRKVYEISSVKSYEITVDTREPLNEDMIDNLLKDFQPIDGKTEVFEENYSKVTESETMEARKGDQTTGVVPLSNSQSISHTKSISERSLSSSSLSKMSLEDLDLSLRSSKSRLSETIDSVTKPLLSSPTLFRRSVVAKDDEMFPESDVNENQNRIQLPLFGRTQSMLMKEMKDKEFRKSLKPFNDLSSGDKNISNE